MEESLGVWNSDKSGHDPQPEPAAVARSSTLSPSLFYLQKDTRYRQEDLFSRLRSLMLHRNRRHIQDEGRNFSIDFSLKCHKVPNKTTQKIPRIQLVQRKFAALNQGLGQLPAAGPPAALVLQH